MFDIPIAYKPVFLNMDIAVIDIQLEDLIVNTSWNLDALNQFFGLNWNSDIIALGKISLEEGNHWVWLKSRGINLASNVYSFLNNKNSERLDWNGWSNIWKLRVALKVKTFIWLLNHGKLKTYEFLYKMNLGPPDPCIFCGLVLESADHLFKLCHFSIKIWNLVASLAHIDTNLVDLVKSGLWLDLHSQGNSVFLASIIAATLWQIWKCRCNTIFRHECVGSDTVAKLVILHVNEFSISPNNHKMLNYIMHNRPMPFMKIFSVAAWNEATGKGGLGFTFLDSKANVCYAGCGPCHFTDTMEIESRALLLALHQSKIARAKVSNIYISSEKLWKLIHLDADSIGWFLPDFIVEVM